MGEPSSIFGWRVVLKYYGWKGFLQDSCLPLIVSFGLCVLSYIKNADMFMLLKHIVEVGISIIPAMVALILTAYTIMQAFIIGDKFDSIKKTKEGRDLIQDLNSSFAACLFVSIISILAMIVISCIINMKIAIENPKELNYCIFFLICYLLVYSVSILIGIVIDVFNSGQTTLLDNGNKAKENSQN